MLDVAGNSTILTNANNVELPASGGSATFVLQMQSAASLSIPIPANATGLKCTFKNSNMTAATQTTYTTASTYSPYLFLGTTYTVSGDTITFNYDNGQIYGHYAETLSYEVLFDSTINEFKN